MKINSKPRLILTLRFCLAALLSIFTGQVFAGSLLDKCYRQPSVLPAPYTPTRTLYVFIDQTMALSSPMKQSVINLVTQWGHKGENVKIARFSANIKGQYSELVFDETGNVQPSEAYLFHIRPKPKQKLLQCIKQREELFQTRLRDVLKSTLNMSSDKLPKTNLLHALKEFAEQVVNEDKDINKTVLLVSDGLENSDLVSFHYRGKIRRINANRTLKLVQTKKLLPYWGDATIYMFGLGYISDANFYVRPKIIKPLKTFWENYFLQGKAILHPYSIGTPMILQKSLM